MAVPDAELTTRTVVTNIDVSSTGIDGEPIRLFF